MGSYILMLQADPDDQYITESALVEMGPSIKMKYLQTIDEMESAVATSGEPALILLNDKGSIRERGQTLRQLKVNPAYSHIPVVVLGEKSSGDYVKECYRAGASTFITKPSSIVGTQKKIELFISYWFEVAEV